MGEAMERQQEEEWRPSGQYIVSQYISRFHFGSINVNTVALNNVNWTSAGEEDGAAKMWPSHDICSEQTPYNPNAQLMSPNRSSREEGISTRMNAAYQLCAV